MKNSKSTLFFTPGRNILLKINRFACGELVHFCNLAVPSVSLESAVEILGHAHFRSDIAICRERRPVFCQKVLASFPKPPVAPLSLALAPSYPYPTVKGLVNETISLLPRAAHARARGYVKDQRKNGKGSLFAFLEVARTLQTAVYIFTADCTCV